jgi:hypothetical protein
MYHLLLPIIAAKQYLTIPKKWRKAVNALEQADVESFSMIHNLGLFAFSLYTFVQLFSAIVRNGIVAQNGYYFNTVNVRPLLFWFYLSKYYEYIDTMILYARKKDPIFLQKFHHVGATFCWHLGYFYEFEGVFFASLVNSGIHTIMYFYYFLSMFKVIRPFVNKYKIYITTMQLTQLVCGFITIPYYYYNKESLVNQRIIIVFDIYIGCLILLFSQFMLKNYSVFSIKTQ